MYRLLDYEVWGTGSSCFVNDVSTIHKNLEIDTSDDENILKKLIEIGYLLPNVTIDKLRFDHNETSIEIFDKVLGTPLGALELEAA